MDCRDNLDLEKFKVRVKDSSVVIDKELGKKKVMTLSKASVGMVPKHIILFLYH